MAFWVYIVASGRNGTIYVGHTDHLERRAMEHREGLLAGFTRRYGCRHLVWAELHPTRDEAFKRERRIKEWRRSWKLLLIEAENPTWKDLFAEDWRRDDHWPALAKAEVGPPSTVSTL